MTTSQAILAATMTLTLGLPATILAVAVAYTLANWPEETWVEKVEPKKIKKETVR